MIVKNDPRIDFQFLIFTAELQRVHDDVATCRRHENRKPLDDCRRYEVSAIWGVDEIAAAHLESHVAEAELRRQVRSQAGAWERGSLGNEGRLGTRRRSERA